MGRIKYIVRQETPKHYQIIRLSPHIYLGKDGEPYDDNSQVYVMSVERRGLFKTVAESICKKLNEEAGNLVEPTTQDADSESTKSEPATRAAEGRSSKARKTKTE